MKLSEIREAYEQLSGKLSDRVHQLALAGIGVIWIFSLDNSDSAISISKDLSIPLILLVLSLSLDVIQYLVSSSIWYRVYCKNRKINKDENREINEKESWNIPGWCIFFVKVIVLFAAYIFLFIHLWKILF